MSSVLFIVHKTTGYTVASLSRDGRGRGTFPSEFYDIIGSNANPQLNYRLKPEFTSYSVGTNTDNCLSNGGNWRNPYVLNPICVAEMQKRLSDGNTAFANDRPLYNDWIAEQNQDLTLDQLISRRGELFFNGMQIEEARIICENLGSDGQINECLMANDEEKRLNDLRIVAIKNRIAIAESMQPGDPNFPNPNLPPPSTKGLSTTQKIGITAFLAVAGSIAVYVGFRK